MLEETVVNEQLPGANMENVRTERRQSVQKLDATYSGIYPWVETEAKTWDELSESLSMLKAAKKMRCRIQRIELENSNLVVTIEKQAREMEVLGEKLLNARITVVESAPGGEQEEPGAEVAASRSQAELMELTLELARMRKQETSCKMKVQKYKELYLKELISNNALFSHLQNRKCEDKEKVQLELFGSVRSLLCALHQETQRTKELQKELAKLKKIFNMPPQEERRHGGRGQSFREVSEVSKAEMGAPVAMLRLEGEAGNGACIHEALSDSILTRMELEMKSIESAIAEVNAQERLVKKELEVIKQLYRGELERIDSASLEWTV